MERNRALTIGAAPMLALSPRSAYLRSQSENPVSQRPLSSTTVTINQGR